MAVSHDTVAAFLEAACVSRTGGHTSGDLVRAESIRAANPDLATAGIYSAAVLADDVAIRAIVSRDPSAATKKGGRHDWDPLTYLCFSRYLRLDPSRSDGFVRAATVLLDAGANPNTGWFEQSHQPKPEWESVLYGAAGVAHHAGLTRLLLARGGDPNDGETPYHTPETHDNGALVALVESGKLTADSLATMLLRKSDWHDYEGIKYLLEQGADPNFRTHWGNTSLHNAALSDNSVAIFELYLDHGGDPMLVATPPPTAYRSTQHLTVAGIAAWRGRGDVLQLFERRGIPVLLNGVDRLLAACARNDAAAIAEITRAEPALTSELLAHQGQLLVQFAGVNNADGVARLLDLGAQVDAIYDRGDGYFGIARHSTALHSAAWRGAHATVKLLLARGASVNAKDGDGRTPLALAVLACVDSYWSERRSPESVAALLQAGASKAGVRFPSGYIEVDRLLESLR